MIQQRHPRTTRHLFAPANHDDSGDPIAGLAIADERTPCGAPVMESIWEPTPRELAILNQGGVVKLSVMGSGHPPVALNAYERDKL